MGYVLKILVDEYKIKSHVGKDLSYSALRKRLENLRALGLVEKIPRTNPAIYNPIDPIASDVRRLILRFAAELVGIVPNSKR
jgi:phage terminase small subunit